MSSTPPNVPPGAVRFRACTEDEIALMARRAVRRGGRRGDAKSHTAIAVLLMVGSLCLFLGPQKQAVGIGLLVVAATLLLVTIAITIRDFTAPVNGELLAVEKERLRRLHQGNCPFCQTAIFVNANDNPKYLDCPNCRGALIFNGGYVSRG
ncbi:hypothetical protein CCAX7_15030 [Capsulimonas corticalis]|uniref:Uncharacterized protein n=1 Tax=Capsulimonas corticalis TaxID=2219043 RepID=A0A402CZF7_9BACT|nr:hypothetical protein [Capsulimonas corticalis]BDI29452.1 hypothetical protein CCAX7_15030 [Capsulimonas corticalis]